MNKLLMLCLSIGAVACAGAEDGDPGACIVLTTNNGWTCLGDDLTVDECVDAAEGVMDVVLAADGSAESGWTMGMTCDEKLAEEAAQDTDA